MLAVLLALAVAGTSWGLTPESGTRIAEGVSTEAVVSGGVTHAWVNSSSGGMVAYQSTDGLTFTALEDALSPRGADAAVVPLPKGGWRMYYTVQTPAGKVIDSAVSGDMLNWAAEPGDRLSLGTSKATGVPEAVVLPDGQVRLYYVASDSARPERIDSAISSDGLNFTVESGDRLTGGYVDPAVVQLANGSWLMVCSTSPSGKQKLYAATSADGLAWTVQATPLLAPTANVLDPTLVPLGGNRFRVYYSVAAPGQALTGPYRVQSGVLAAVAAKKTVPAKQVKPAKKATKAKAKKKK